MSAAESEDIMNYETAKNQWDNTRKRKLANNTYLVKSQADDSFGIKLHNTIIIELYPNKTVFNTNGWRTVTTKARINEFTEFNCYQDRGIWYIGKGISWNKNFNSFVVFADNITYNHKASKWSKIGESPQKTQTLRRQIKKYAKDFTKALFAGEVSKPSNGDCWYCSLYTQDKKPLGEAANNQTHIKEHIKESYFVPSLCLNACKTFGVSQVAYSVLGDLWENIDDGKLVKAFGDIAKKQIETAIRRYCYRQCSTA